MDKLKIRKTRVGKVVSDKMTNTAVVQVEVWKVRRVIKKRYKRHGRFMAENPNNKYKTGDLVRIAESKPLSLNKRWIITGLAGAKESR